MRAAHFIAAAFGFGPMLLGGFASGAENRLDTVNTIGCAEEGGVCRIPYPTNVYFGVPGKTNGRPFPQGGTVACNVQTFGDPAPGKHKSCWYAPRLTDSGGGAGRFRDDGRGRRGDDRDDDRPRDDYRSRGDGGYRDDDRRRRDFERDDDRPRRQYDDYGSERRRYRTVPDDE